MKLNEDDFRRVNECAFYMKEHYYVYYIGDYGSVVRKCNTCGILYSDKILNEKGLIKYWTNYESKVHCADDETTKKRKKMYEIEYNFIKQYISSDSSVLDVGCADGSFLDCFRNDEDCNYHLSGVEFGNEAYDMAKQKGYCMEMGELPNINFGDKKFDLIIFRGVIQYFIDPQKYFLKAISLLNPNGRIYICSSPNASSLCCDLFREKFILPVGPTDYQMFTPEALTKWFHKNSCVLEGQSFLYEKTPYANVVKDTHNVKKRMNEKETSESKCPAFYDNMLTLVFKKI